MIKIVLAASILLSQAAPIVQEKDYKFIDCKVISAVRGSYIATDGIKHEFYFLSSDIQKEDRLTTGDLVTVVLDHDGEIVKVVKNYE